MYLCCLLDQNLENDQDHASVEKKVRLEDPAPSRFLQSCAHMIFMVPNTYLFSCCLPIIVSTSNCLGNQNAHLVRLKKEYFLILCFLFCFAFIQAWLLLSVCVLSHIHTIKVHKLTEIPTLLLFRQRVIS
jgi:hypothetical protein